jgi:hypothetical protein
MERIMLDLQRFTSAPEVSSTVRDKPQLRSMLVVEAGDNGGEGATALVCWAAVDASSRGEADYVRLVTSLDLLSAGGGDEEARAAALVERFSEAGEMSNSLLVLDDVDQLCAGSGPGGYSSIMLATLRALLRSPPSASLNNFKTGGHSQTKETKDGRERGKTLRILAATSRSDAACVMLHELYDGTLVFPLLCKLDEVHEMRYPHGISQDPPSMETIMRDLERFTSIPEVSSTVKVRHQLQSMLVVGADDNGGAGAALACWAAVDASNRREADYVRLVTSLDMLSAGGGDEEARAATLVERFSEAGEMFNSLLVLDDVDKLCAGSGPGGYSSIMLATLRALLRFPPASSNSAEVGVHSQAKKTKAGRKRDKTLRILAATSRSDAACAMLHELFDETLVVKPLRPHISSKLPYINTSKPNTTVLRSILKKKGTPKASSPRWLIQNVEHEALPEISQQYKISRS